MTDTEIKAAVAKMQAKRSTREVWQNDNGTWSHHKDGQCEWSDRVACETDLLFHIEHERVNL